LLLLLWLEVMELRKADAPNDFDLENIVE
jgi:hypothetical protein